MSNGAASIARSFIGTTKPTAISISTAAVA
jgi:hypothetical protein